MIASSFMSLLVLTLIYRAVNLEPSGRMLKPILDKVR